MAGISEQDYIQAATELGCEVAVIKAVAEVESAGSGFLPDGQCKILFEAHVFDRLTGGKYRRKYPNISSKSWNKALYGASGQRQHDRLALAGSLDREAALQSASYGKFQVMGFNWKVCGYSNLQAFINDVIASEAGQLRAFVGYVKNRGLADELQRKDWDGFAYGYNGSRYAENRYAEKMAAAYRRLAV